MTSYDPNIVPDPQHWQTLEGTEAQGLVEEYHRSPRCEHPLAPNPHSHATIHVIVENQIAMGDEAPVAATVERLIAEGLSRHQAVHAVGSVLAASLLHAVKGHGDGEEFEANYYGALPGLKAESWLQWGGDEQLDFGDPDGELDGDLEGILNVDEEDGVTLEADERDHEHECGDPHCDHEGVTFRRESPKIGRNDPCSCGSGKKYKKCCLVNASG